MYQVLFVCRLYVFWYIGPKLTVASLRVLYHFIQSVSHASRPPFYVPKFGACHESQYGFYELILEVTIRGKTQNMNEKCFQVLEVML